MKTVNYSGIIGCVLVIAGWFSPMLHVPILGNWNYWSLDTSLASIVMLLAIAGIWTSVSGKENLLKWISRLTFFVIVFTLIAVYFKINDYFSFIPMKKLAAVAASIVKFKWIGWILLFSGSLIMMFAGRKSKIV